jgi:UDP-N-acetylglucosamine:LPS N-acetylglucosamine transferase
MLQLASAFALAILVRGIQGLADNEPTSNPRSEEDAPAPMALHSFKAHVADGQIHVTANPASTGKANMSRQPKLLATGQEGGQGKGVVIVGGGSGGFHAIESLREVSAKKT